MRHPERHAANRLYPKAGRPNAASMPLFYLFVRENKRNVSSSKATKNKVISPERNLVW